MAGFDVTQPYFEEVEGQTYGHDVFVADQETHSRLLGPDGEPLEYEPVKLGFDLTPKQGLAGNG